jgi:hypothetical protein
MIKETELTDQDRDNIARLGDVERQINVRTNPSPADTAAYDKSFFASFINSNPPEILAQLPERIAARERLLSSRQAVAER